MKPIWDVATVLFAASIPVLGEIIDNGVASVVVVLIALALMFAWRRFGQPRAQLAPTEPS
ncbi:MAG: hypothetical protein ACRDF9_10670 [Candidatus Limnocylindria bacterium]